MRYKSTNPAMSHTNHSLSATQRKLRKLRTKPVLFVKDSQPYLRAIKTAYATWARLGSFLLVLLTSLLVVVYYGLIASPRYVSQVIFVVEQANGQEVTLGGLASLGATSLSSKDAYIIMAFIESRELAERLDTKLQLQSHYALPKWDWFSRLNDKATAEEYLAFYQGHTRVSYDELAGILTLEVQTFSPEYSQKVAQLILTESEAFINQLGVKMVNNQMDFAKLEVSRAHTAFLQQQKALVSFQDTNKLFNPEQQSGALLEVINQLESSLVVLESELKILLTYMHQSAPEVVTKQNNIEALKAQLLEEQARLTTGDASSLNKINSAFQEIKLNTELALQLYKNSLAGLEATRVEAYQKLKHLLIIQSAKIAHEASYPRRLYSIFTWFVSLLIMYLVAKLIVAIIKEHAE
ncbi:lipopolysaccharide biosynthesis protein [Paraglaciecola arctica]|uniref:lipopolysaccharide biosynthesis protein n=1 Tax=Paraglaciecola arctica TaxID=1128911 RepID=UPI001C07826E|nr:lipopolysaccharide biosynthesis protein [Paraglaciecola arctica]MBU3003366.1 lipopolysaccharide biosynthesis protein [Paraglaciecola arctica]